jgi:hypothetical protein
MECLGKKRTFGLKIAAVLFVITLGLFYDANDARSASPEAFPTPENLGFLLTQMFPPESIIAPYRIEVWVASTGGNRREGAKTLIEECLKEDLRGLAETEPVSFLSSEKALLRLRVWFTQSEGPEAGECYDTTFAVVVGKINPELPTSEVVLDAYSVAGKYENQLYQMCGKVALRLDLKILSVLRDIRSAAPQK